MGRSPCCEKMGLKKGPWSPEEDHILISFIQRYGHGNWRTLPKQAGLPRCGKSCRLRWINHLRPGIKRGKFSDEEEEIIINLHQILGNKWSAIASMLPGRTDNEIKNFWHARLKKRFGNTQENSNQHLMINMKQHYNCSSTTQAQAVQYCCCSASDQASSTILNDLFQFPNFDTSNSVKGNLGSCQLNGSNQIDDADQETEFWYNLLSKAEDL